MAEYTGAGFFAGALRNLACHHLGDAAETKCAALNVAFDLLTVLGSRAFGHDHNRAKVAGGMPRLDRGGDFFVIEWDLRDENDVGAAGDAAVQGDPARVASH